MGLLDNLFNFGNSGGILSSLLNAGNQNGNQQAPVDMTGANMIPIGGYGGYMMPSFGRPPAQDQSAPNMIPIGGYGGYMMPSFGRPDAAPQTTADASSALPPSVANANAQAPQPQAPQAPQAPQGLPQQPATFPAFLQTPAQTNGPISQALFDFSQRLSGKDPVAARQQQAQDLETKRQLFQTLAADPSIGPNKAMQLMANPDIYKMLQTQTNSDRDFAEKVREFKMNYGLAASREARANQTPAEAATERAAAAQKFGIQPGTPEYNQYVLNGTLPAPTQGIPAGFQRNADGSMSPVPGGPNDPKYLASAAAAEAAAKNGGVKVLGKGGELYTVDDKGQPQILHKNADSADATLSDDTVNAMADQYLAGDRTVLTNLGRGVQGAANVVKLREAIHSRALAAGIDPKGIVQNFNEQAGALAGQRAVGTRAANISLAANEANNMIPIALAASDKLPRSQYMPWNQMVQAVQKGTSSPELASFVAATNSLVNSYVRAVSPSGVPTDSMREHAYSMLNAAQGPEAYKAVIATMKQEMQAALQAPTQVRKELRGEGGGDQQPAKADPLGIR